MSWVFGKLVGGGIRICDCGETTLEDEAHWHEDDVPFEIEDEAEEELSWFDYIDAGN